MSAAITVENIEKANAQFWEQMLAMRLEPCLDAHELPEVARCIGARHVVAHCDLSGVWMGRIEVRISHGLAVEATARACIARSEMAAAGDFLPAAIACAAPPCEAS